MDTYAAWAANTLVGNSRDAAILEMTLTGPELRFHENQLIWLCGENTRNCGWQVCSAMSSGRNSRRQCAEIWFMPIRLCRGYMAFAGGSLCLRSWAAEAQVQQVGWNEGSQSTCEGYAAYRRVFISLTSDVAVVDQASGKEQPADGCTCLVFIQQRMACLPS